MPIQFYTIASKYKSYIVHIDSVYVKIKILLQEDYERYDTTQIIEICIILILMINEK